MGTVRRPTLRPRTWLQLKLRGFIAFAAVRILTAISFAVSTLMLVLPLTKVLRRFHERRHLFSIVHTHSHSAILHTQCEACYLHSDAQHKCMVVFGVCVC